MQAAVQQNSVLVETIARASGEQASAIDEVLVSVRQLDEKTR